MKISIVGAGGWGTALAGMLGQKYSEVWLWARNNSVINTINEVHCNEQYLPGVKLPENLNCTNDLEKALEDSNIIIIAAPSHAVRETAQKISPFVKKGMIIVSVAKGFELKTLQRMSEVIGEEISISADSIAVLSGPNHAEEVGRRYPTTSVVAGKSEDTMKHIQSVLMMPYFRVYTNPDIVGVELGGALKNIIAVGTGMVEGLGFGDNTKAALITRGIAEMVRLGLAMNANSLTFSGLSGLGDLVATCTGKYSRNRQAGIQFAKEYSREVIQEQTNMVVEGIRTTLAACKLADKYAVEMPITREIYEVVYNNKSPKQAVLELMSRGHAQETEELAEGKFCGKFV